jgi:hypothetical protein
MGGFVGIPASSQFPVSQINHSGDVKDFYALRMVKNKER